MKQRVIPLKASFMLIGTVKSQIAIGKTAVSKASVSLEFANTRNRAFTLNDVKTVDINIQTDKKESTTIKATIGANGIIDTTFGVLALPDANKAMKLSKMVNPYLNVINSVYGMIQYDIVKKRLTA